MCTARIAEPRILKESSSAGNAAPDWKRFAPSATLPTRPNSSFVGSADRPCPHLRNRSPKNLISKKGRVKGKVKKGLEILGVEVDTTLPFLFFPSTFCPNTPWHRPLQRRPERKT